MSHYFWKCPIHFDTGGDNVPLSKFLSLSLHYDDFAIEMNNVDFTVWLTVTCSESHPTCLISLWLGAVLIMMLASFTACAVSIVTLECSALNQSVAVARSGNLSTQELLPSGECSSTVRFSGSDMLRLRHRQHSLRGMVLVSDQLALLPSWLVSWLPQPSSLRAAFLRKYGVTSLRYLTEIKIQTHSLSTLLTCTLA